MDRSSHLGLWPSCSGGSAVRSQGRSRKASAGLTSTQPAASTSRCLTSRPRNGSTHRNKHGVVDQDDGDVHFEPAEGEPDGADHQRPERDSPAGRPQLRSLERLLFAGGQCQSDSGEDGEQGRGASGKHEPHPGGGELGVGLEGGEDMGGHHAQKGQPAGGVDARTAGRRGCRFAASGFAPALPRAVLAEEAVPRGVMLRSSHIRLCGRPARKLRGRGTLVFEYMFE